MRDRARVVVITAPRTVEVREVELPELAPDEGLLEIETNGVCGSDVEFYEGALPGYPVPMTVGHEPAGRVVALGAEAGARWGVGVGDRVVVNSALRCGHCRLCAEGLDCRERSYGTLSPDVAPGLWGGAATHLFLPPQATLIPIPEDVDTAALAFHNPLANGFEWVAEASRLDEDTAKDIAVTVLGAGPRGLACALVAVHLGAAHVELAALERDRPRLELAERLGVHSTVVLDGREPGELRERGAAQPDVVVDTTPRSVVAVRQAVAAVADGGRVVLAGIKGRDRELTLPADAIGTRRLTLVGPPSKTERSLRRAVAALGAGQLPLNGLTSRAFPLDGFAAAVELLSDPDPDRPVAVRIDPRG